MAEGMHERASCIDISGVRMNLRIQISHKVNLRAKHKAKYWVESERTTELSPAVYQRAMAPAVTAKRAVPMSETEAKPLAPESEEALVEALAEEEDAVEAPEAAEAAEEAEVESAEVESTEDAAAAATVLAEEEELQQIELISSLAAIECKSDSYSVDSVEPVAAVEVETQELLEPATDIRMSLVLCRVWHGLTDGDRAAVVDGTSAVCNLNRHRSARGNVNSPSKRSARLLSEILQGSGRGFTTGDDGKIVRS